MKIALTIFLSFSLLYICAVAYAKKHPLTPEQLEQLKRDNEYFDNLDYDGMP